MDPSRTWFLSAILVTTLMRADSLAAQQPPQPPAPGPDHEVAARSERIRAEIAALGAAHAWAGSYYRGDGLDVNISVDIAPKAGFAFTLRGCMGVYDRNHGSVTEQDGQLALTFQLPSKREGTLGLASTLIPVTWGERHYLIASDQMLQFANQVNGGIEPRRGPHGATLLRRGDEDKPVQGQPPLPKEFAGLLLDKPIDGLIVAVRESRVEKGDILSKRMTTAVVDRGAQHGLREGMRLYFTGGQRSLSTITVTKVAAQTAQVAIETLGDGKAKVPAEGWSWSTRAPWAN